MATPSEKYENIAEIKKFLEYCKTLQPNKSNGKPKDKGPLAAMINQVKGKATPLLDKFLTDEDLESLAGASPDILDDA